MKYKIDKSQVEKISKKQVLYFKTPKLRFVLFFSSQMKNSYCCYRTILFMKSYFL